MKRLVFWAFIFVQMYCFGQCSIDKKYLHAFFNSFPTYEVRSSIKDFGYSRGECHVITSVEYALLNRYTLDTTSENEIFYDIVHKSAGEKDKIVSILTRDSINPKDAEVLATYMLCKHSAKYAAWKEAKRQYYLELVKSGQIKPLEEIYLLTAEMPEFPGGIPGLTKFIYDNLKYPFSAAIAKIEGRVFVQMVIDTNGYIQNPVIVKGIGYGCNEEALRLINSMPNWKPGKNEFGERVHVRYSIPILFKMH